MTSTTNRLRNRFIAALTGTRLLALCCFAPILVISLGVVGLSAMTPYLNYVLLPALVILILVVVRAYQKWQGSQK